LSVWLVLGAASASCCASELSKEVSPLIKADLDSSHLVVRNLKQLAARQSGNEMVRTQRLAAAIRNLFIAEFHIGEANKSVATGEKEARDYERTARDWMKPNAFGRVNPANAKAALKKAADIRKDAARTLARAQDELVRQARELEVVMRNFHELGEISLVIRLGETLRRVTTRALGKDAFNPLFSQAAIAAMKRTVAMQDEWRTVAAQAERAGRPEKALRFHVMAGDMDAARRAAAQVVPELLQAGLYGSAIDACEIAGDHEQADRLRAAHPQRPAGAFRELTADELGWRLASSCVRISNGKSHAAGFFFSRDGHILTTLSAVADRAAAVIVRLPDERRFQAQRVAARDDSGLAIVRIPLSRHQTLFLGSNGDLKSDKAVALLAQPDPGPGPPAVSPARITGIAGLRAAPPTLLVALPSGSHPPGTPLVDDRGRVLAMLRQTAQPNPAAQSFAATPPDTLRAFLRDHAKAGFSFR